MCSRAFALRAASWMRFRTHRLFGARDDFVVEGARLESVAFELKPPRRRTPNEGCCCCASPQPNFRQPLPRVEHRQLFASPRYSRPIEVAPFRWNHSPDDTLLIECDVAREAVVITRDLFHRSTPVSRITHLPLRPFRRRPLM